MTCDSKHSAVDLLLTQLTDLIEKQKLAPNQILVSVTGISLDEFEAQVKTGPHSFARVDKIARFPLTSIDRRIAFGTAESVQGLEADAVIALLWPEHGVDTAYVRDIYVSASRAKALLTVISPYGQQGLFKLSKWLQRDALSKLVDE